MKWYKAKCVKECIFKGVRRLPGSLYEGPDEPPKHFEVVGVTEIADAPAASVRVCPHCGNALPVAEAPKACADAEGPSEAEWKDDTPVGACDYEGASMPNIRGGGGGDGSGGGSAGVPESAAVSGETPVPAGPEANGEPGTDTAVADGEPGADPGKTLSQLKHTSTAKLLEMAASIGLSFKGEVERATLIEAIQNREREIYGTTREE